MASKVLLDVLGPNIARIPAMRPVMAMNLKLNANDNEATNNGRNSAPNAPPTCPIPSVSAKPEDLALGA